MLTKRGLIGGGATLLLADVGFAISGYPSLVTHRPFSLWILGGIAMGLIILGFLLPGDSHHDSDKAAPANNNQQTIGSVAGGSALGNQVTVNVQPVPAFAAAEIPPAPTKPAAAGNIEPVPNLRLSFVRIKVSHESGVFDYDPSGFLALLIMVVNAPGAQGEFAADARSIFAVLNFTGTSGRQTPIGRACWLRHELNEITIPIGDSAHILIGSGRDADDWLTYYNPNRHNPEADEGRPPINRVEPRRVDFWDGETLEIDVRIVSSRGQTLAHRQFLLTRDGIAYNAKWKE